MDEWINIDRILKFPSEGNRLEKEKKKADEINQILNEGHSSSSSAILEFRDPPARKRPRSESSTSATAGPGGKGKGKENSVAVNFSSGRTVSTPNMAAAHAAQATKAGKYS